MVIIIIIWIIVIVFNFSTNNFYTHIQTADIIKIPTGNYYYLRQT